MGTVGVQDEKTHFNDLRHLSPDRLQQWSLHNDRSNFSALWQ
ncbi:hypothetical protein [Vibrio vulnificus YJ016]|uniref:Uncharacterized protein n=1 Tax=Vibrio vulnificus (strain YJ016) TaxID=196600 RepID=Q7MNS8_VIBVY|nr:hypothetical protein [Vibrio vulnificus YJ016]